MVHPSFLLGLLLPVVLAHSPPAPILTYLFTMNSTLGSAINTGNGSEGTRLAIPVTGGTVQGPRGNGTILPVGGDFGAVDDLGNFNVDSRFVIQMSDGTYVFANAQGPVVNPAASGLIAVDRIKFETGSKNYLWLNEIFTVGITNDTGPWVKIDVWQVAPAF